MHYEDFTTLAAAEARAAELRASGRRAYVLTFRAEAHQVRSW